MFYFMSSHLAMDVNLQDQVMPFLYNLYHNMSTIWPRKHLFYLSANEGGKMAQNHWTVTDKNKVINRVIHVCK